MGCTHSPRMTTDDCELEVANASRSAEPRARSEPEEKALHRGARDEPELHQTAYIIGQSPATPVLRSGTNRRYNSKFARKPEIANGFERRVRIPNGIMFRQMRQCIVSDFICSLCHARLSFRNSSTPIPSPSFTNYQSTLFTLCTRFQLEHQYQWIQHSLPVKMLQTLSSTDTNLPCLQLSSSSFFSQWQHYSIPGRCSVRELGS